MRTIRHRTVPCPSCLSYDSQGRLTSQTYEDGDTVTYQYDNDGALAVVTDSATGITTRYYYDFTGRTMKYTESASGYSHSVGYDYDDINNLISQVETINGTSHTTTYEYDKDNRVKSKTTDGITVTYTYDTLGRITQQITTNGTATILTESYTYTANSSQIATYRTVSSGYDVTYTYTYDDNGNILTVNDGTYTTSYVYDSQNQLTRENNQAGGFTHVWNYDNAGNLRSRKNFEYTTGELDFGSHDDSDTWAYEYRNTTWGDLLTGFSYYNGDICSSIIYDKVGNVLADTNEIEGYEYYYTWEHGRELTTLFDGTTTWTYTYDASGMRTKRTDGTNTYSYVYNGSQLVQMTVGENTLYFTYDSAGIPATVTYNGTVYYYTTNVQGDITGILKSDGTQAVTYTYDAWGNILSCTGSMADTLGAINPLRYRGYVYDQETGLYYLQSRYYDPEIGRFINADASLCVWYGLLGINLFAYCGNNPIARRDSTGYSWEEFWENTWEWIVDLYERSMNIYQQQQATDNRVRQQQIDLASDAGQSVWDAYVHSNELQVEKQYQQDMAIKDNIQSEFESWIEDPARAGDYVFMTGGNIATYIGYVSCVVNPTIGAVVSLAFGIASSIWGTLRYYEIF